MNIYRGEETIKLSAMAHSPWGWKERPVTRKVKKKVCRKGVVSRKERKTKFRRYPRRENQRK